MALLAITVLGHDRPGIIAEVTAHLARLGGNIEDSTMTLLRGHFAMVLVVEVDSSAPAVEVALAPVTADGTLQVVAREVPIEQSAYGDGVPYVLSVHGADRPGIVSPLLAVLAAAGGNVTDLSTRLLGELYVLVAEVDLPGDADVEQLRGRLADVAGGLGVDAVLRPSDADLL